MDKRTSIKLHTNVFLALALASGLAACESARHTDTGTASLQMSDKAIDDADDNEVVIALADLPAAVRAALAAITAEDRVTQVVRESDDGKTTYDVEYTKDGAKWAVEFSATGSVLENEQDDDDHDNDADNN